MVTRDEWVGVASSLRFAMVHGCLSKNGRIPFDDEAVDRDVRAELHNWVWFNKQTVE
jgi:hypothetical protein